MYFASLSYLSPATPAHRRYALRRVRQGRPDRRVVIADWSAEPGEPKVLDDETAALRAIGEALDAARQQPAAACAA